MKRLAAVAATALVLASGCTGGGNDTATPPTRSPVRARPLPRPVRVRSTPQGITLGDPKFSPLPGARGLYSAEQVRQAVRPRVHYMPQTRALSIEQTANIVGGVCWPLLKKTAPTDWEVSTNGRVDSYLNWIGGETINTGNSGNKVDPNNPASIDRYVLVGATSVGPTGGDQDRTYRTCRGSAVPGPLHA